VYLISNKAGGIGEVIFFKVMTIQIVISFINKRGGWIEEEIHTCIALATRGDDSGFPLLICLLVHLLFPLVAWKLQVHQHSLRSQGFLFSFRSRRGGQNVDISKVRLQESTR